MIGGTDISYPSQADDSSLELCVRAIRQFWPGMIIEDDETNKRYDEFWQISFGDMKEIFVYQDEETADRWDDAGASPELEDTMIHIIRGQGEVFLVVDNPDCSPMKEILQTIKTGLSQDVFAVSAELVAA